MGKTRVGDYEMNRGISCALRGYRIECSGPLHLHHILNFSKARGNNRLRKMLAKNPAELTAMVCEAHNVGRWADTREAMRRLLLHNAKRYGEARVRRVYEEAIGLLKVVPPEWRWEAIVGVKQDEDVLDELVEEGGDDED